MTVYKSKSTQYKAVSRDGHYGLGWHKKTFDEIVEQTNAQIANAKEKGYNDDQTYLIVRVVTQIQRTSEGVFIKKVTTEDVVGTYKAGKVERFIVKRKKKSVE